MGAVATPSLLLSATNAVTLAPVTTTRQLAAANLAERKARQLARQSVTAKQSFGGGGGGGGGGSDSDGPAVW
jgi:hypothetical protein